MARLYIGGVVLLGKSFLRGSKTPCWGAGIYAKQQAIREAVGESRRLPQGASIRYLSGSPFFFSCPNNERLKKVTINFFDVGPDFVTEKWFCLLVDKEAVTFKAIFVHSE